jgi:hypothetical protein
MRLQIGEAIHDLQQAEQFTPELTHAHHGARLVTRDLLQLCGLRPLRLVGTFDPASRESVGTVADQDAHFERFFRTGHRRDRRRS